MADRQTSFIEISIEAEILRGGKGAIYASVGLCVVVTCGTELRAPLNLASSLRMQLGLVLSISVSSLAISRLVRGFV